MAEILVSDWCDHRPPLLGGDTNSMAHARPDAGNGGPGVCNGGPAPVGETAALADPVWPRGMRKNEKADSL